MSSFDFSIHYTTIHRELTCVGISLKKLKRIVKERNEEKRTNFLIHMSQYSPEQLGFEYRIHCICVHQAFARICTLLFICLFSLKMSLLSTFLQTAVTSLYLWE